MELLHSSYFIHVKGIILSLSQALIAEKCLSSRYRWGYIHWRKKAFCFKSKTEISPTLTEDWSNQCSFCVYAGCVRSARRRCIYHGVGMLFLHRSFRKGVWRCLSFVDVRRQVSRLSCFYTISVFLDIRFVRLPRVTCFAERI